MSETKKWEIGKLFSDWECIVTTREQLAARVASELKNNKDKKVLWVASGAREAEAIAAYLARVELKAEPSVKVNRTGIELSNGSKLQMVPASPDGIRGFSAELLVFAPAEQIPLGAILEIAMPSSAVKGVQIILAKWN